ncbi:MAG: cache domain-containing protein [Nanoarchaeota archaeon]
MRLIAYFLIILIISSVSISYIAMVKTKEALMSEKSENYRILAEELLFNINNVLLQAKEDVHVLSANPIIASENASTETKRKELVKMKNVWGKYEDIILTDTEGDVIAATDYLYSGKFKTQAIFKEAIQGHTTASNVHFISPPLRAIMSFAGPVYRDEEIVGVIILQLNMERISLISDHIRIGETGFSFVISEQGKILAHPDKDLILKNADELLMDEIRRMPEQLELKIDGIEYVGNFYQLKGTTGPYNGWSAVIVQDEEELLEPINASLKSIALLIAALIVGTAVLGTIFANAVANPIEKLTENINKITKGDFSISLDQNKIVEIRDLTESMNRILASLKLAILRSGVSKKELHIGTPDKESKGILSKQKNDD